MYQINKNWGYNYTRQVKDNFYVCSVYGYVARVELYEIEILYLLNRVKTYNFVIYEVIKLDNGKKFVYLRNYDNNMMYRITIPKLKKIYRLKNWYIWQNVYYWKTKKGVRKVITSYDLINNHEKRKYEVGDINKYGHKLIKISHEPFFRDVYKELYEVGLNIDNKFVEL